MFPTWIRVKAPVENSVSLLKNDIGFKTVCEECNCPNIGDCWSKKHAAFMAMGRVCTRRCRFCSVANGELSPLDEEEPQKLALAVQTLSLKHVVVTSVDRDDLPDGGASHFAKIILEIRKKNPEISIEVLTPDFKNKGDSWKLIAEAKPDVFNHNIEVVRRLFPKIKIAAKYENSLELLKKVKEYNSEIFTKSGLIVGIGETNEEILQTMDDLRSVDVDFLTIGQYLKPKTTNENVMKRLMDIDRFVTPEEFKMFENVAYQKGFTMVSSSPLTRSSYHAGDDFKKLKERKNI